MINWCVPFCLHYLFIFSYILTSCYLLMLCVESLYNLLTCMDKYMLGRTPLDEGSTRCRDFYLTTHDTQQQTKIRALSGIRTRNPRKEAASNPLP
jgi:hypothetical protein